MLGRMHDYRLPRHGVAAGAVSDSVERQRWRAAMTLPEALARVERLLAPSVLSMECRITLGEREALTLLLAEVQRLREALPTPEELRDTEWMAGVEADQCPACTHSRERGWHAKDCWIGRLAALLETP